MNCHCQFVYFPVWCPTLLSLYRGHTLTTVLVLFALKRSMFRKLSGVNDGMGAASRLTETWR